MRKNDRQVFVGRSKVQVNHFDKSAKQSVRKATSLTEHHTKPKSTLASNTYHTASHGSIFKQTVQLLVTNFFRHHIGRSGAALAYYLLFALFPLLIFVSNLLGQLNLDVVSITRSLTSFLPRDIVEIITSYLEYVSQSSSGSLVFTVYFPMRATRSLMDDVRRAYYLQEPKHPVSFAIRQLVYTVRQSRCDKDKKLNVDLKGLVNI